MTIIITILEQLSTAPVMAGNLDSVPSNSKCPKVAQCYFFSSMIFFKILANPKKDSLPDHLHRHTDPNHSQILSLLGTVPSTPITIGTMFARIFHISLNSLARSWYFYFLSSFVSSSLVSFGMAASINWKFFSLIPLDSSIMFTISAGSSPGSGALMSSHGPHSIVKTFRKMWFDPRRAIF